MSITKEVTSELVKTYGLSEGNTGCPEVQIAIWTHRINALIEIYISQCNEKYGINYPIIPDTRT